MWLSTFTLGLLLMATPPSYIQDAPVADWSLTTSPRSGTSRAYQDGDVLAAIIAIANGASSPNYSVSGGSGFSYTTQRTGPSAATVGQAWIRLFSAIVNGAQSFAPAFTRIAGNNGVQYGGDVLTFRGSDGIGATNVYTSATAVTAPSGSFTTTGDNSAIVIGIADWNAVIGTRTYRTINGSAGTEVANFADGSTYGVHIGYWADAGAAGTVTVGMSAPSQAWEMVAIEILGTAAAPPDPTIKYSYRDFPKFPLRAA